MTTRTRLLYTPTGLAVAYVGSAPLWREVHRGEHRFYTKKDDTAPRWTCNCVFGAKHFKRTNKRTISIDADGVSVWVNDSYCCLARFGRAGIDVHKAIRPNKPKPETECLHCTHEKTTWHDWQHFKASVEEHHGVVVTDDFMLKRFRGRAALKERCPTCGAPVKTIFAHVDGCPHEKRTRKSNSKRKAKS